MNDTAPIGFWRQIVEDLRTYHWNVSSAGLLAILIYRYGHKVMRWPRLLRLPFALFYYPLFLLVRNCYGIEIPYGARVGRRVIFAHQHGIVISHFATIGDDCLIRQGVTIGAISHSRPREAPTLGRGVEVGAGAVIIGKITIGDGAKIGANAVVNQDVAPGMLAVAPRALLIPPKPPILIDLPATPVEQAPSDTVV